MNFFHVRNDLNFLHGIAILERSGTPLRQGLGNSCAGAQKVICISEGNLHKFMTKLIGTLANGSCQHVKGMRSARVIN